MGWPPYSATLTTGKNGGLLPQLCLSLDRKLNPKMAVYALFLRSSLSCLFFLLQSSALLSQPNCSVQSSDRVGGGELICELQALKLSVFRLGQHPPFIQFSSDLHSAALALQLHSQSKFDSSNVLESSEAVTPIFFSLLK